MKAAKKTIIWSNENLDLKDWDEFFEENFPEVTNDYEKYRLMHEENNVYLEDERRNLEIHVGSPIIVLADLGLWDGRTKAYRFIESGVVGDCLYDNDCEYGTWYCDDKDFKFTGHHHDGTNHYTYRKLKESLTINQVTNFFKKLRSGKCDEKAISRYTESIRPYISKVYGWK